MTIEQFRNSEYYSEFMEYLCDMSDFIIRIKTGLNNNDLNDFDKENNTENYKPKYQNMFNNIYDELEQVCEEMMNLPHI